MSALVDIPAPFNDTSKFFCYSAMNHGIASLPGGEGAEAGSSEFVFTYVCNGKALGDCFLPGGEAVYIPQFVRVTAASGPSFRPLAGHDTQTHQTEREHAIHS